MAKRITGKILNEAWQVGAKHALYREDGKWYHQLRDFPGALFDRNGYILFATEDEYEKCPHVQIQQDVHIPNGISSIPGYVRKQP
jgi:5-methylcytosine-specific restriction enzyme A